MANFTNISFLSPFKWVPVNSTLNHFDEQWNYDQIKSFEVKKCYKQKWQFGDETPQQMVSTVAPSDLKVYNSSKVLVKSIPWTLISNGGSLGNLYECIVNLDSDGGSPATSLPAGTYYLYQQCTLLSYNYEVISEPIEVKTFHPNTRVITYSNSKNDFGCYFNFGTKFKVRVEIDLTDFEPDNETFSYVDQIHNNQILSGTPFRKWKLSVGRAPGVADYVADLLNRIFVCDTVRIDGKLFCKVQGAKWEPNRVKGYPMAGWTLEVTEQINLSGLQYNDGTPLAPGIVLGYGIRTPLFSKEPGTQIQIEDYQQT